MPPLINKRNLREFVLTKIKEILKDRMGWGKIKEINKEVNKVS